MATILYIEDEPSLRDVIIETLKDAGHLVFGAGNGSEGLDFIKKSPPDLIICDIEMPEMNGPELLKELRQNYPEFSLIPFIFLSANASQSDLVKGLDMGADDYICKPVDFDFLSSKINSSLRLRGEYEQKLSKNDTIDEVTGLPNMASAMKHLSGCLEATRTIKGDLSVIVAGIKDLKKLSATLGVNQATKLLKQVAFRIQAFSKDKDDISYLGDGEFMILSPGRENSTGEVARQVLDAVSVPIVVGDADIYPIVNIGQACFPDDGTDVRSLFHNAYAAKSSAEKNHGSTYCRFSAVFTARENDRLDIQRQLYSALEAAEFYLCYQPIIDAKTGRPVDVEVLLRWQNETLGNVPPEVFIPIAEEAGLIDEIFLWVLRTACRQQVEWQTQMGAPSKISVNVSPFQLRDAGFANVVLDVLKETGMSAEYLNIELTENVLLGFDEQTKLIFNKLSAEGINLSIDDFGTGYSSLSYLDNLPFNILKIDRAFISNVIENSQKSILVLTMIDLAHSLGLKVTAEGVENREQLEFLQKNKCDFIQGHHYARPMSSEAYSEYLGNHSECNLVA